MYRSRTYELEINSSAKPAQVLVNGSHMKSWSYDSGKLMLTISQSNTREKQTVKIRK